MENLIIFIYVYAIGLTLGSAAVAAAIAFRVPAPHKIWALVLTFVVWFFMKGPAMLAFLCGFVASN